MVTGRTVLLGMGTGELLQLPCGAGMAVTALLGQHIVHGNIQRGVRDVMAGYAVEKIWPVRLGVALAAFRHNFIPVVSLRVI